MTNAILCNPRNCYQNYNVAVNLSNRTIYTYMGPLRPRAANANYCTAGEQQGRPPVAPEIVIQGFMAMSAQWKISVGGDLCVPPGCPPEGAHPGAPLQVLRV